VLQIALAKPSQPDKNGSGLSVDGLTRAVQEYQAHISYLSGKLGGDIA